MELDIEGRAALIGGASSGLGRAVAVALAREGCRLALWARQREPLEALATELRDAHGSEVTVLTADAASPETARALAAAAADALGRVDIAVLNAGGPPPCDPLETEADGWRAAFQLLAITPIDLASRLLPGMRASGWGRIVAILSSGVREPIETLAYSNGGRAALVTWMKAASRSLAHDGVTVNGVIPGRIDTPRVSALDEAAAARAGTAAAEIRAASVDAIPLGRYGEPAEFAAMVAFLCSRHAGYQTGSLVTVDGGMLHGV